MSALVFYDIENAVQITALNLGTVAPSSSDDTMLRLFNTDDNYQADNVTIAATGSDAIQLWLSTDGDVFTASITVGDIAPNGSSPPFWLRRVTPADAAPTGNAALAATPASWSTTLDSTTSNNVFLDTAG